MPRKATHNPLTDIQAQERVVELAYADTPVREIANQLGISLSRVYEILADAAQPTADAIDTRASLLRALAFERYDKLISMLLRKAMPHDAELSEDHIKALKLASQLMRDQSKLAGLIAPKRVEVGHTFDGGLPVRFISHREAAAAMLPPDDADDEFESVTEH